MKPVWDLHCGDCLDPVTGLASLGDKSVDHVITDPPYSRDLYTRFRTNKGSLPHRSNDAAVQLASGRIGAIDDIMRPIAEHVGRVLRRWAIIFCDVEIVHRWRTELEAAGLEHARVGAWVKSQPTPQISGDRPGQGFEACEIAHPTGRKRWNGGGSAGTWFGASEKTRDRPDHPCPKPEWLMERLVRDFTDPGDLILDPFMGSGTTGVAAIRLGRRFIGWEKDPKYHAIALKRLTAAKEQLELCA